MEAFVSSYYYDSSSQLNIGRHQNHLHYMGSTADETVELDKGPCRRIRKDDQCFLMYFIMGVYFGPDLKIQKPRKSALQRITEGLAPYTSDHLGGSHMRIEELEQIYCFLLRKSDKSIVVNLPVFHEFLRGKQPKQDEDAPRYLQFPDLFPALLHRFSESVDGSTVIENIVYIDNPETYYLKPDDVRRFKRLTGQENFCIRGCTTKDIVYYTRKRRLDEEAFSVTPNGKLDTHRLALTPYAENSKPEPMAGPAMVVLPSEMSVEELNGIVARSRYGYALTGSAVKGQVGPAIGLMDIGEAEDSYLFRVALPGVKKEGGAFRCEVESDGKVLIKGETVTGEKTVHLYTQTFEMQTQNLCPPGPFSISFRLPGPVDHRQFMGSFGTDGVLEGIVMKAGRSGTTG